jgi:o-succinylbenzoate---CoA ligase
VDAWLSWAELDSLAGEWAKRFRSLSLRPGDRVAVAEPAGVTFAALLFGCLRSGASFVPISPRSPAPDVERILADCRPRLLVRDGLVSELPAPARRAEDEAVVIYTSGTTGPAKGVKLTLANLVASAEGCQESLGSDDTDRWLLCLAPHHVGGLSIFMRSALANQPLVSLPRFEAKAVLDTIATHRVTLLSLVPTMLIRLLQAGGQETLRGLRAILLGGAPAPAELVNAWAAQGLAVCPGYGLTESASQVTTIPLGRAVELAGSAGLAHSRARIEIVDGEIVVLGPTIASGYVNPSIQPGPAEGRFATGDLGRLDEAGVLWVLGRRDDAIITGGENVHPEEVEAILRACPGVEDAAVGGRPDPVWGQVLEAFVVGTASADAVKTFCRGQLPSFKVPRRIRFTTALPRSEGGKLLRGCLFLGHFE